MKNLTVTAFFLLIAAFAWASDLPVEARIDLKPLQSDQIPHI
jgi:hypothetical protein